MSNTIFDCTQPSEAYNPKNPGEYRIGGGKAGSFGSVTNPIEDEMKDIEMVKKTYALLPLISFFDNSDATLRLFRNLKEFSPTQGSCIGDIARYVLGGEISITRKKEEGLQEVNEDVQISTTEREAMKNFVKSLNPNYQRRAFVHLHETAKSIYQNKKTYGNSFLKVDMITVGRSKYVYFESIDAEKCRYWATMPTEPKIIAVSALWNFDYITRNPPQLIGAYPNISDLGNGVQSTIIHDFEKAVSRDWYGLPDSIQSLYWQYVEMQEGQYFNESFANDFTGRVFIEYVGESESDQTDFEEAVEETFTNKAGKNKKRIMTRMRLPDDSAALIHEFSSNTEHEFYSTISDLGEQQIIKSHSWNKILMGVPIAGKLGTSQEFFDIYTIKNTSVINPLRHATMQSINTALSLAEEFMTGSTGLTDTVSLGLGDLYQNLINNLNKQNNGKSF